MLLGDTQGLLGVQLTTTESQNIRKRSKRNFYRHQTTLETLYASHGLLETPQYSSGLSEYQKMGLLGTPIDSQRLLLTPRDSFDSQGLPYSPLGLQRMPREPNRPFRHLQGLPGSLTDSQRLPGVLRASKGMLGTTKSLTDIYQLWPQGLSWSLRDS